MIATSLALVLTVSALGGSVLAQAEPEPDPSMSPQPPAAADPSALPEPSVEALTVPSVPQPGLAFSDPDWRKITSARGPASREDHTWTVDGDGRFAYLFGGRDGERDYGDLWRYDLERDAWKKLSPKGKRPQPRFGHSAVWVDGYGLVVFAGQKGTDFFDDLWVYRPEARTWRKLPAKGSVPKPRYGSCMVAGPDGRLWISHGFTTAGRFDDTRAYDLDRKRWASITPDGRKPGERCLHDCFTSASGELVLYGGQDDGAFALGDLWVMGRDRSWDRQPDPQLKARRLYAVTEAGPYAYVFGGAGEDNSAFDDLWRVDRETLEFRRLRVEGNGPAARYAGTLITDAERGRLLLFGGQGKTAKDDVWELVDRAPALVAASPDLSAEPGSLTSPEVVMEATPSPLP